jgi:hypothetical protein
MLIDPKRFPATVLALSKLVSDRTVAISYASKVAKGERTLRTRDQMVRRAMVLNLSGPL